MEFPHYTWGYIGMPAFSSALPCVPSLYVRIYRSEPIRCRAFSGSLTIREGISSWKIMNVKSHHVPSLYVRVYRTLTPGNCFCSRSLTIREGISKDKFKRTKIEVFPHYTWWYIALVHLISDFLTVPSLYVRVYREKGGYVLTVTCSLTIREGISECEKTMIISEPFPHYTWGYIDITNGRRTTTPVPSLYVRVYRTENEVLLLWDGSFTIREGISKRNAKKDAKIAFPHYMWGYIGHFRFFQNHSY